MRRLTYFCDPSGIRTRVTAVRGRRTRPLYDGASDVTIMPRGRYAGIIRAQLKPVSIRRYAATQPATPRWLSAHAVGVSKPLVARFRYAATRLLNRRAWRVSTSSTDERRPRLDEHAAGSRHNLHVDRQRPQSLAIRIRHDVRSIHRHALALLQAHLGLAHVSA
jgi:hypothetical protein